MDRHIAGAAFVVIAVLAGCSGGGGEEQPNLGDGTGEDGGSGGASPPGVIFWPTSMTYSTWEDWGGRGWYLTATVTPVPSEPPYASVVDSGTAFVAGSPLTGTTVRTGSYRFTAMMKNELEPGPYTGTLTVKLCHDALCADPYAFPESTIPYVITVLDVVSGLDPLTAVVTIDDAVVADTNEGMSGDVRTYSITMESGHTVELVPSLPFYTQSAYVDDPSVAMTMLPPSDPGTVRAALAFASPTAQSGSAVLSGRGDGGRTVRLTVNLTP